LRISRAITARERSRTPVLLQVSRRSFLRTSAAALIAAASRHRLAAEDPAPGVLCRKLASDPLRPQYHLLPAHNWMNDPNGPIYFHGRYHMFHQYNPRGAIWGNMNWAHATSPDLIHWHHEPIALSPTPGGPDQDGVFSGSAVLDGNRPTMIYTGVGPLQSDSDATLRDGVHTWRETQCLAVAQDDDLRSWKKFPEPVIAAPPSGLVVTGFRDPYVWRENGQWMLILGSGIRGKGGAILLYSSPDLHHWTYLHPLLEGKPTGNEGSNPVDTGDMWECPDFFPLGKKHVLLISTMARVHWKVGTYANRRFTPEQEGIVDWGSYYAAKTMLDANGNRILWGWIPETRPDSELVAAGWSGVMSLPRVLSLDKENHLGTSVAPAVKQLRGRHLGFDHNTDALARSRFLERLRIHDLAAELSVEIVPKADQFSIALQSEDGTRFTSVSVANNNGQRELRVGRVSCPLPEATTSAIRLHMFLDGSVLEVFVNDSTAVTARVYEIPSSPLRLALEGHAQISSLGVWQMNRISNDRLTAPLCS
jgi:beta-fructofuranosidase